MSHRVAPFGTQAITVPSGQKIAVFSKGRFNLRQRLGGGNTAPVFTQLSQHDGVEVVITPATDVDTIEITSYGEDAYYDVAITPDITQKSPSLIPTTAVTGDGVVYIPAIRNTIADAGTITVGQHRQKMLYQDASGGNVTMTTATGTALDTAFPDMKVGDSIQQWMSSNHATNSSTIAGGTGVTIIGFGGIARNGAGYLLIKTGTALYDLVRCG